MDVQGQPGEATCCMSQGSSNAVFLNFSNSNLSCFLYILMTSLHKFALIVLTITAAELAIGLALLFVVAMRFVLLLMLFDNQHHKGLT